MSAYVSSGFVLVSLGSFSFDCDVTVVSCAAFGGSVMGGGVVVLSTYSYVPISSSVAASLCGVSVGPVRCWVTVSRCDSLSLDWSCVVVFLVMLALILGDFGCSAASVYGVADCGCVVVSAVVSLYVGDGVPAEAVIGDEDIVVRLLIADMASSSVLTIVMFEDELYGCSSV